MERRVHRTGVREFRENLAHWIDIAAAGEDVIVTERGEPRVRVTDASAQAFFAQLVRDGKVRPPTKPWRPLKARVRVEGEPVSEEIFRGHGH